MLNNSDTYDTDEKQEFLNIAAEHLEIAEEQKKHGKLTAAVFYYRRAAECFEKGGAEEKKLECLKNINIQEQKLDQIIEILEKEEGKINPEKFEFGIIADKQRKTALRFLNSNNPNKKPAAFYFAQAAECFEKAGYKEEAEKDRAMALKYRKKLEENKNSFNDTDQTAGSYQSFHSGNRSEDLELDEIKEDDVRRLRRRLIRRFHTPFFIKFEKPIPNFLLVPETKRSLNVQDENAKSTEDSALIFTEDAPSQVTEETPLLKKEHAEQRPNNERPALLRVCLYNIYEGTRFFFGRAWPLAFGGLFLTDLIRFMMNPAGRYGNTAGDLWLGTADWGQILAGRLGIDLPGETMYWLPPAIIWAAFTAPLVLQSVLYCMSAKHETTANVSLYNYGSSPRSFWKSLNTSLNPFSEHSRNLEEARFALCLAKKALTDTQKKQMAKALKIIAGKRPWPVSALAAQILAEGGFAGEIPDKKFPLSVYVSYLKWSHGVNPESKLADFLFPPAALLWFLWQLYAGLRFFEMTGIKLWDFGDYETAKDTCLRDKKLYKFLTDFGNKECVPCGYPYVSDKDKFSVQKCLDGLLKQSKEEILKELPVLLERGNITRGNTTVVDLSEHNFRNWTANETQQLFDIFEDSTEKLDNLIVSAPQPSSLFPEETAKILGQFMLRALTKNVVLDNQGIEDLELGYVFPETNNRTERLHLAYNGLTDQSAELIAKRLPGLRVLSLRGNPMSCFDSVTKNLSLTELDISDTQITPEGLVTLLSSTEFMKNLCVLRLGSNTGLATADWGQIIGLLQNSGVTELDLSGACLNDSAVTAIAAGLPGTRIKKLNLANNAFYNEGFLEIMSAPKTAALREAVFDGNSITQNGLKAAASLLSETGLTKIGLSSISSDKSGFVAFMDKLGTGGVVSLTVKNNNLDDGWLISVANSARCLKFFDASDNPLTDKSGTVWAETLTNSTMETAVFSNTGFTDVTLKAIAVSLPESGLMQLVIADARLGGGNGLPALADVLNRTQLVLLDVSGNRNITNEEARLFAVATVKNVPNSELLGVKYNIFQTRRIIENGGPSSQLKQANLGDNLGPEAIKAIGLTGTVSGVRYGKAVPVEFKEPEEGPVFFGAVLKNKQENTETLRSTVGFFARKAGSRNPQPVNLINAPVHAPAANLAAGFLPMALGLLAITGEGGPPPSPQTTGAVVSYDPKVLITVGLFALLIILLICRLINCAAASDHDNDNENQKRGLFNV